MSSQKENFLVLVDRAMQVQGRSHMKPVIEKELLHYDILFTLDDVGLLDNLTFQGGTSLRLCYGASRYSEDLDFAGGKNFKTEDLMDMKTCIEDYLGKRYDLEVTVKEPNEMVQDLKEQEIKISKWQIRIATQPERRDLPKQVIKIEVGNIPAYTREPRQLRQNYDFLPDGYNDTLVMVETLDEILVDKLVSLVNSSYIRYRDIWDLHWLKQQNVEMNSNLVLKKINDYKIDNYLVKCQEMIERLPDIIHGKEFKQQMSRFIPMEVQERTILKEKFFPFLQIEITSMLTSLMQSL